MSSLANDWIDKAEGDLRTAQREFDAQDRPNYDAVSFHAQQCAEKYLKALLVEKGKPFPRTHDLEALLELVLARCPELAPLREELRSLTDQAVEVRYPGASAECGDAEGALETAKRVRARVRGSLGLT